MKSVISNSIKQNIVSALELPRDLSDKSAIITIVGNSQILVENFKGILNYSDTAIRILTHKETITFLGSKLYISYYSTYEMKIIGTIKEIIYDT